MSRAFVKEPDGDQVGEDLPERPRSPHPNYVTPAGFRQLKERVRELLAGKARLTGSEDMNARQQLHNIQRDLRYYEERLEGAIVVDPAQQPEDRVHFGATVEVLDEDGASHRYTIVGEDEADVARGKISWISPLAKALLNASAGEAVIWRRPAGDLELEVVAIHKGQS